MLNAPAVHKLLFSISFLFGLGTPLLSEEVSVNIDLGTRTGHIGHRRILSTEQNAERIAEAFEKLDSVKAFQERIDGVHLKEVMVHSVKNELRIEVFFTFKDKEAMFRQLGLEKDDEERIHFRTLKKEEPIESNGKASNEGIEWDDDVRKLYFKLSGEPLDKSERSEAVELKGTEQ